MMKPASRGSNLCSAILLLLAVAGWSDASGQCTTPGSCSSDADAANARDRQCSLYLAPSTIPDAGLGLFSGRDIPPGESLHEYLSFAEDEPEWVPLPESSTWTDLFIPVWNRGGRPFASWMGYVWPSYPGAMWSDKANAGFDGDEGLAWADGDVYLAEDGRRTEDGEGGLISPVSAYAFGIASLANSHKKLNNIKRDTSLFDNLEQMENHKGLLDPEATFTPNELVQLNAPWDAGVGAFAPTHGNDFEVTRNVREGMELLLNYGEGWHERQSDRGNRDGTVEKALSPNDIVRSLDWLEEKGICLFDATITSAPSRIPHAGRGAFAARSIKKGEVLAVSPMLTVAREDLKVTYSNGDQILLNYAFGHADSSILLVPMAPVVGYINHSSEKANAKIRWPEPESDAQKLFRGSNELFERPVADILKMSGKIAIEYVALRNIREGEEIVIDYGNEWEEMWLAFARMHPYERPGYFRRAAEVPSGFYPEAWLDITER